MWSTLPASTSIRCSARWKRNSRVASFSPQLEQSLHRALRLANTRRHEYCTLEHLLLALLEDQDAIAVLRACGVEVEKLKEALTAYLEVELAGLIGAGGDAKPTAGFQRVVQRA